ncbi:hydrogenase maturation protease [Paractinoplanes hotanensis]|uniref:Hydrogenase maturation protease n=1 Tax=Paractinoplanes hotanensis TaxID=2906497 RepID=A0ABT0Y671_9ACTN|nr:hydrogenase maturation protease [Actinoplanes hotanensis]MCM4080972.1 hydrogenase maturation protease [Actinoplanes hotanensis]
MNVLVAGVGNLFLGDDGFGPAVVRRLAASEQPPGVRVADYGIRGMHLAYDLLAGYDRLVLVDALPGRGGPPAEIVVLEISADDLGAGTFDAHGMDPATVLAQVGRLGGTLPPTYVVGCRAVSVSGGIGLTPPVEAAIPAAVDAVRSLVSKGRA